MLTFNYLFGVVPSLYSINFE